MKENKVSKIVEELRNKAKIFKDSGCAVDGIVQAFENSANTIEELFEEIQQYRAIGTIEECKKAVEIEKKILKHCESSCADCHYKDPNDINKCMHDFLR